MDTPSANSHSNHNDPYQYLGSDEEFDSGDYESNTPKTSSDEDDNEEMMSRQPSDCKII